MSCVSEPPGTLPLAAFDAGPIVRRIRSSYLHQYYADIHHQYLIIESLLFKDEC